MLMVKNKINGFTIVELLVVIVVIGILASITVVSYTGITNKAAESVIKSDLSSSLTMLNMDNINNGAYPLTKEAADSGRGLPKSTNTSYQYALAANNYCLTATSTLTSSVYRVSSVGGAIESGACNYNQSLVNNMVAYWKLDESSGNTIDSAGGYTGLNSNATYSAGKINNGGVFNGTNSYIDIQNTAGITFTNQLTLSAWVKPNSLIHAYTDRGVITKNGPLGEIFYLSHEGDVTGTVDTWAGFVDIGASEKWIFSTTNPVPGNWYYIVMTYDGANQKFYVNGVLESTIAMTGMISNYTNDIVLGTRSLNGTTPWRVFNGTIDEVAIWKRALSAGEITSIYNAGNGLRFP